MELTNKTLSSISRFWRTRVRRFGIYETVVPTDTTPGRDVPNDIKTPNYISGKFLPISSTPEVKDATQIEGMRRSCELAANILTKVQRFVRPGVTTDDIDDLVHRLSIEARAYPSPLRYKGFPKSVCTSVNNVAVHGIPDLRHLLDGDIVNVDITVYFEGYHGDCSKTFPVGGVDDKGLQLINVTEQCLELAINWCGPNVPFKEIGARIYNHAKRNGLTVLPAFIGHGIGNFFHGPPEIYHIRNRYPGFMKPGMTFTIEPVLSHGSENTVILEDGWTVITEDGSRAAQAEHTILITENGAEILTK